MAVPKRKTSKARRDSRRPQCHELKLPHAVCKKCGYYDGEKVIDMDKKDKKEA